jgi:HPt (histidine-containing phosphotransfer) domain-containing protein
MPPFDAALLMREYGDERLVRDLARLLIDTAPPQVDAVTKAIADRDGAALRAAAHKLRGSILPFGAAEAVENARKLELMGAQGQWSGADALSRELSTGVRSLCDSARSWLEARPAGPS